MQHQFSYSLGHLQLRPMLMEHIEDMRILRNKFRYCFVNSNEISAEEQKNWYTIYLHTENDYMFSIFFQEKWIGAVSLYHVTPQSAEFGRLVLDSVKAGQHGLGVTAVCAACKIGFSQLSLSEIYLDVYEDNLTAVKTYEKAGFTFVNYTFDMQGKRMLHMTCRNNKGE